MALKGKFNFFNTLLAADAYAVIDSIQLSKGGDASFHVNVYPAAPTTKAVLRDALVDGVMEKVAVDEINRGQVIEHFGISVTGITGEPFGECYAALKTHERFTDMSDA